MATFEEAQKKIAMRVANGLILPKYTFAIEDMNEIADLEIRNGDVFIVTYPKCGTTWMQYIVWGIRNNGALPPLLEEMLSNAVPFLEMVGVEAAKKMPPPRTIKLHTPHKYTPISTRAKYIIVVRNPFDCCVSYFHHIKNMSGIFLSHDLTLEQFFELFMNGLVPFCDYFDFLNSWLVHKEDPNVIFLFYEEMKSNPRGETQKISQFLRHKYCNDEVLDRILAHSSFPFMKQHCRLFLPKDLETNQLEEIPFIRKGVVGDWRNHMTQVQKERLMTKIEERITDSEIRAKLIPFGLLDEMK